MNHTHQDMADLVDADIVHAFGAALGDEKPEAANDLPVVWFDEIRPNLNALWLVKGLLPRTGIALCYGHPGSGKTFWALDIAMHVAMNWPWQGLTTEQGLVVYVGAEGLSGLRNRISAFRKYHDISGAIPFALVPASIDMQDPKADTERLIASINSACANSGFEPRLVVIDTLSKTFGSGKENTDDMASYVANCEKIAGTFDCCVMPVHHRPKDAESKEPRGHSSLKGGVDTVVLIEAGLTKKATVHKQKDGEDGNVFMFNLKQVEIGVDDDGETVTSCIVEHTKVDNSLPTDPKAAARKRLSDKQRQVLSELGKCLEHHGQAVPAEIPSSHINTFMTTKVTTRDLWRDTYLAIACPDRDSRDTNRDSERKAWLRAVEKLQSVGLVGTWEGYAWLN